jgi:hypothetical protein
MLPKISHGLLLALQIIVCLSILMHIFSANSQIPEPELHLEMIYKNEIAVGEEETLQAVLRNNGTDTAINVTMGLYIPLDVFNVTLARKIGPDDLSPSHNMSIFFKIIALKPGNFSIEPIITYFDHKGKEHQIFWEPSINIKVNPASTSPFEYLGVIIVPIVIICIIATIYVATRKQFEHYFRKPRQHSSQ